MPNLEFEGSALEKYLSGELDDKYKEIIELDGDPSIPLFRFINKLDQEVGIYKAAGTWYLLIGDYGSFPIMQVPEESEVIIHTHPGRNDVLGRVPTIYDFIHHQSLSTRYFVATDIGIVRYWPIETTLDQYMKLYAFGRRDVLPIGEREVRYLEEMRTYGCEWVVHPWQNIDSQEELMSILQTMH